MLGLDRFFENADDDPISGDNAPRGVIFDRYREYSALAKRRPDRLFHAGVRRL
jgi:hypothetical protein